MATKTIYVSREDLLEWLAEWGDIKENDEIVKVEIGYTQEVRFVIESSGEGD